jgi:hypothetical protein
MRHALTIVFAIAFSAVIAGCSGGPVKQINPPRASIQQLSVQPNGKWQVTVRLQNFSSVSTAFELVDAKLVFAGQAGVTIVLKPAMTIGPESADILTTVLVPELGAKLAVASALSSNQSLRYVLSGQIVTSEPKGNYNFTYESTLNPAPGLDGVMR